MVTDLDAWQVLKVLTTALVRFKMGIGQAEDFELLDGQLDDYYVAKAQSSRDAKLWIPTQKNMVRTVANIKHFHAYFYFTLLAV